MEEKHIAQGWWAGGGNERATSARWLQEQNHEVFSVYDEARGADDALLAKAYAENWILITNDKAFGERVYRKGFPHRGVILLRLEDERVSNKIAVLRALLENYAEQLANRSVVVTEKQVRFSSRDE